MTKETYSSIVNTTLSIQSLEITLDSLVELKKSLLHYCDHRYPSGEDARTYDADGAYCHICNHFI